eukprot:575765-Heterocapsa_arctica.AAC.1
MRSLRGGPAVPALPRLLVYPQGSVARSENARDVQQEGLYLVRLKNDLVAALGRDAASMGGRRGFSRAVRMM